MSASKIQSEGSKAASSGITRRDLGVGLASVAGVEAFRRWVWERYPRLHRWPFGRTTTQRPYTGALDGFEKKVDLSTFDPKLFALRQDDAAPLRMTFQAKSRVEAEQWQKSLRAKLVELIGGFPEERLPISTQTLEVRDFPTYKREKFVFQSRPGLTVLGYLLTPKSGKAPHPIVIALPGHGRGVDDLVAIDRQGRDRVAKPYDGKPPEDWRDYQYDYAVQAVQHGLAAVAIEPLGFGCRRDPTESTTPYHDGLDEYACYPWASAALLLGQSAMSWRIYDVIRTVDWIETRNELDPARVGCMGISNGGECTIYAAAIDTRIRAALASGSLNTYRDSLMSYVHCIDAYIPGILNWAELYDIAGLVAPRAFFAESGARDLIFPIAGSRASFERVKKIYEVFGAPDMTDHEVFDGPHLFWGRRGLPFLAQHLA